MRTPARMTIPARLPRAASAVLAVAAALLASLSAGAASAGTAARPAAAAAMRRACPSPPPGQLSCFALYRPQTTVNRAIAGHATGPAAKPAGLTPREIQAAYRLPAGRASKQTVAVSIAYDTPDLASYLSHYRRYFGLPPCTVASGCFRVVNQRGAAAPLPRSGAGSGWDLEATLDVSMISAACPHCRILVVEASSATTSDLAATEQAAARLGAQVISNSYGSRETGSDLAHRNAWTPAGHTVVAASGDYGYSAASFPADLQNVTAVSGTELTSARNARGWTERVWNNASGAASGGCSAYVSKPSWQHDLNCPGRTVADVAAVAWNVPIYNRHYGGWVTVGGTSVAAPLIAGVFGLAGNASRIGPGRLYAHARSLFDVTTGNNAWFESARLACGGDYLCVAGPGYDAPAGLGTPDGTGAF